jgi:hypothetical protein
LNLIEITGLGYVLQFAHSHLLLQRQFKEEPHRARVDIGGVGKQVYFTFGSWPRPWLSLDVNRIFDATNNATYSTENIDGTIWLASEACVLTGEFQLFAFVRNVRSQDNVAVVIIQINCLQLDIDPVVKS